MRLRSSSTRPGIVFREAAPTPPLALLLLVSCCAYATAPASPGRQDEAKPAASSSHGAVTQVFTDRDAFIAALAGAPVENKFGELGHGATGGLRYSDHGFEYLIYTQFGALGALYNDRNAVSTDRATDEIVVSVTGGNPVTAIGGNFFSTDFAQRPIDGTVTVNLSDGTSETIDSTGPTGFLGFIAPEPIFGLTVNAPENPARAGSPDRWPTMARLIIGNGP
jgi:hypothetical protein